MCSSPGLGRFLQAYLVSVRLFYAQIGSVHLRVRRLSESATPHFFSPWHEKIFRFFGLTPLVEWKEADSFSIRPYPRNVYVVYWERTDFFPAVFHCRFPSSFASLFFRIVGGGRGVRTIGFSSGVCERFEGCALLIDIADSDHLNFKNERFCCVGGQCSSVPPFWWDRSRRRF